MVELGGLGGGRNSILLAWQACSTFKALLISPLLNLTRLSIASGSILTPSSSMTLSTKTLMSGSFRGLNLKRVHLESKAGESLCV